MTSLQMRTVADPASDGTPRPGKPAKASAILQRSTFTTSRLLDSCSHKELTSQTGHGSAAWPLVIAKELMDNALDACEEASTPPNISVQVSDAGVTITDNGPGLPDETVHGLLDFGVRLSSREAYIAPTRGAQGNALQTILAMPFVLDGKQGKVIITAQGVCHSINISVDQIRQRPILVHLREPEPSASVGTTVAVCWPASARSLLHAARDRFLQLVDSYTFLNPHLTLTVDWFGHQTAHVASNQTWKKWRPSDPTCPHWYGPEHLERLIAAYITHDEHHGRQRTVREFIGEFRDLAGSAKQKAILDATGLSRAALTQLVDGNALCHDKIKELLQAMQEQAKKVKPSALGLIGKAHLKERFESHGCNMGTFKYKKITDETDRVPSLVEMAFAECPKRESRYLIPAVNWSAAIGNPFRALGQAGQSLDGLLQEQRVALNAPVVFLLHLARPGIEFTDRGKAGMVLGGDEATVEQSLLPHEKEGLQP